MAFQAWRALLAALLRLELERLKALAKTEEERRWLEAKAVPRVPTTRMKELARLLEGRVTTASQPGRIRRLTSTTTSTTGRIQTPFCLNTSRGGRQPQTSCCPCRSFHAASRRSKDASVGQRNLRRRWKR